MLLPELYESIKEGKPELVVISELYGAGENQGKIDAHYQCADGSNGLNAKIGGTDCFRNSVTTKSNHILLRLSGYGKPKVYCERRIEDLMRWANA